MKRRHLVLVGKNGRIASKKNQASEANELFAVRLSEDQLGSGQGGGIVTLLIPKNRKGWERVRRNNMTYTFKWVTVRAKGERGTVQDAVLDDAYMACLAVRYEKAHAGKPKYFSAPVREFANWIVAQLADTHSEVYRLTKQHRSDSRVLHALHEGRGAGWWRKQIASRKNAS